MKIVHTLSTPRGQFESQGIGTVYANSIVATLKGSVEFNENEGSTLVASAVGITVDDNCNVKFTKKLVKMELLFLYWRHLGSISETTLL